MDATLTRLSTDFNCPTFGILKINDLSLVTMELPWKGNAKEVSCIPTGTYTCKRTLASLHITKPYGQTFEIENVPNRSDILFHIANFQKDLKGCIGLGTSFGKLSGFDVILRSMTAFDKFMQTLKDVYNFSLTIKNINE